MDKETLKTLDRLLKDKVNDRVGEKRHREMMALLGDLSTDIAGNIGDHIREMLQGIKNVTVPEITIPEIKMPDIVIPEIKIPKITVPKPEVTVNIPEIKIPEIKAPNVTVNTPDIIFPETKRESNLPEYDSGSVRYTLDPVGEVWTLFKNSVVVATITIEYSDKEKEQLLNFKIERNEI